MNAKMTMNLIKSIGNKYSCRWKADLCISQLEFSITITARKGKNKQIFSRKISWLEQIEDCNWFKEFLADVYRWFNIYFINKGRFDVRSSFDKRISRIT